MSGNFFDTSVSNKGQDKFNPSPSEFLGLILLISSSKHHKQSWLCISHSAHSVHSILREINFTPKVAKVKHPGFCVTMTQNKSKNQLRIHPEPFKPSYLGVPPSPFSPRAPVTPQAIPQRRIRTYPVPDTSEPLPSCPLQWVWQCHQCHRTYALGVTRRCLEDGHNFCAGTTTVKTWRRPTRPRKIKRHRACASEFDYQGWKTWGVWRRSGRRDSIYDDEYFSSSSSSSSDSSSIISESEKSVESEKEKLKDCWNTCDYPSECRWGKRFGVRTPVATAFPASERTTPVEPSSPAPTTFEGNLKPETCKDPTSTAGKKTEKKDLWDALIASATRRRSVPPSSPLADVPERMEVDSENSRKDMKAMGGETAVVDTIDPALLAPEANPAPSTQLSTITTTITSSASFNTLKAFLDATVPLSTSGRGQNKSFKGLIRCKSKIFTKGARLNENEDKHLSTSQENSYMENSDGNDNLLELAPPKRVRRVDSGYYSDVS